MPSNGAGVHSTGLERVASGRDAQNQAGCIHNTSGDVDLACDGPECIGTRLEARAVAAGRVVGPGGSAHVKDGLEPGGTSVSGGAHAERAGHARRGRAARGTSRRAVGGLSRCVRVAVKVVGQRWASRAGGVRGCTLRGLVASGGAGKRRWRGGRQSPLRREGWQDG